MEERKKSYYYQLYKEEELEFSKFKSLYEKLAHFAGELLQIEPDEETKKKLQEAINFAHLNLTPRGVVSFAILVFLIFLLLGIVLFFLSILSLTSLGIYILFSLLLAYYYYYYPLRLKTIYQLKAGSELVMMILHIVIYMRNFPNLENAVKFASDNLTGPLVLDLRKILWDVENAVYSSMEEALIDYSYKWRGIFREFSDAINLIIYSTYVTGRRRIEMLDQAISLVLDGIKEKSERYIIRIKPSIELINAVGILLPTLTLTLLPMVSVFLNELASTNLLVAGYNFLLPLILVFIIKNVLDERVVTLPLPDISLHPDLPKRGYFKVGNIQIPSVLPPFLIFLPFLFYLYLSFENMSIYDSLIFSFGMFFCVSFFFLLNSYQKVKIREKVYTLEEEFRELLFVLGKEIERGIPLELAMSKVVPVLRGTSSKEFLISTLNKLKYKGVGLREAIFGEGGTIHNFPSKLIHSVIRAILDAAEKGTEIVSRIMVSISEHLYNLHKLQVNIEEKFSEIVGSMSMQAKILIPFLAGVMNVLTFMMIKIINQIQINISNLPAQGASVPYASFITSLWKSLDITPASFQLIMGLYTLEAIIILSWFINGILVGEDEISLHYNIGKNLIFGGILYILITFIGLIIVAPFILSLTSISS